LRNRNDPGRHDTVDPSKYRIIKQVSDPVFERNLLREILISGRDRPTWCYPCYGCGSWVKEMWYKAELTTRRRPRPEEDPLNYLQY